MIQTQSNLALSYAQAGYLVDNQQFGTWNGTATSAGLVTQYGKTPNTARAVNIYRTDWQGRQLLYPTARTNFIGEAIPGGGGFWGSDANTTVTLNAGTAPDGSSTATELTISSAGPGGIYIFPHAVFPAIPNPPNGLVTLSLWMMAVGSPCTVGLGCDQSGGYVENHTLTLSWQRFSTTFDWTGSGDIDVVIDVPASSTIMVQFAQYEVGATATAFYNPGSGLDTPITDYTLTGTTVNLAQAPASTATTNATFYAT